MKDWKRIAILAGITIIVLILFLWKFGLGGTLLFVAGYLLANWLPIAQVLKIIATITRIVTIAIDWAQDLFTGIQDLFTGSKTTPGKK